MAVGFGIAFRPREADFFALRGKVRDYVDRLAFQINASVVCQHEEQCLWLLSEGLRFNPIGDVIVRFWTDALFPIGQNAGYDRFLPQPFICLHRKLEMLADLET